MAALADTVSARLSELATLRDCRVGNSANGVSLTILISLEDVNVLVSLGDIPGWIRDSLTSVVLLKYEGDSEAFEELKIDGLEA